ncbi:MAG: hypothetical protein JWM41_442 [Gemmatimonadetes bacterium]|nr:hypothetical protein [Gemmatimonadota bacterium]
MPSYTHPSDVSNGRRWAGRTLSGIAVLFLLFDSSIKLLNLSVVADSMNQLGYPVRLAPVIGAIELVCLTVYVVPRTSILGAILLTGYLGGAISTHLRVGDPLFSHVLFPLNVAALIWGGLYLRDRRVRTLLPLETVPPLR